MKVFAIAATVLGVAVSSAAASPQAKDPLLIRGGFGHLVMPGDRAMVGYTVYSGSKAVRGSLFVRNDRQKSFTRLPLLRSNDYRVRLPKRLIREKRLLYYAAFTDPRARHSLRLPAHGTSTISILNKPIVVRLGTHRFGGTKAPEAVVARASANEVSWDISPEFHLGPQTFQVGADGSVWLEDSFADRLLAWSPGAPDRFARSVPVPYGAGISDVAFGPAGSLYVTKVLSDRPGLVLDRLDATSGTVIWEAPLAGAFEGRPDGNTYPSTGRGSPLRVGPDGTLYCLVLMGRPGDEWGWMPVATPSGRPLSPNAQLRGNRWPYQPATAALRLIGGEVYTPRDDMAPHEIRYALVDPRDRVVRSWRVLSTTEMNFRGPVVPAFAGGAPVVIVDFIEGPKWEYEVLRLGRRGAVTQFSLARAVFGDSTLTDVRVGPDGRLYQLTTSPSTGVTVRRYSLEAAS